MPNPNENELNAFIKSEIKETSKKVKGKHPPIAEVVDNVLRSLSVKSIYDLNEQEKRFFFITVKNYSTQPKLRHFLAISLANSSSDLLVQFARDFALKNDLRLIQYSIYPKPVRIQLLSLKEIKDTKDLRNSSELLKGVRKEFRDRLVKLKNLVENE